MKVFRTQLASKNPYYSYPDINVTELYQILEKNIPLAKSESLKPEYLIKTEIIDKNEIQNQIFLSEERVKELLNKPTDPEYEEFEASLLKNSNLKHEKELLEQFEGKNEEYEDVEDYLPDIKLDVNYEKYKFLLELNRNEEILRYVRGRTTVPMWYSEHNHWETKEIPKCQHCGGNRVFELQINSTFLNLYKEFLEFDWGIIAIYT